MNNMMLVGAIFMMIPVLWVAYKTVTDETWRDVILGVVVPILMATSFALGISLLIAALTK